MIFFHVRPGIISGVYEIRNRISNKSYIGSASDIRARWSNHARLLKKTTHPNLHLQESFKKHFDALEDTSFMEFHIIEQMPCSTKKQRLEKETYWITQAVEQYGRRNIFNINLDPANEQSSIWAKNPEEAKEKIRKKALGRKHTAETKKKLSIAKAGSIPWNKNLTGVAPPAWNKGMIGKYHLGPPSAETRQKISQANIGKISSEESKRKNRESHLGKNSHWYGKDGHTEEAKRKISEAHKGKRLTPQNEFKKGNIPWTKGKKLSEETKRKISNANSGRARADIQGSKHHGAKALDLSDDPVISPGGNEYVKIECIREFCKLHGINSSCTFGSVLNGKKKSYYGWMLKSVKLSMNKETTIQNSEIENE
jgi:group I intron endonuclease